MTNLNSELTLEILDKMEPHEIFKFSGARNSERTFMYVAKRGQVNDWAIYTSLNAVPMVDFWAGESKGIAAHGEKLRDEKLIRELVPCTDEAFGRYRF